MTGYTGQINKESGVIFTPKVEEEGKIDEFSILNTIPIEEIIPANTPSLVEQNQAEETKEPKELTEEEKRANLIQAIKESKIKFRPIKHTAVKTIAINAIARPFGGTRLVREKAVMTNITTNQFGSAYRQKRKAKNRMQKQSRKNNR